LLVAAAAAAVVVVVVVAAVAAATEVVGELMHDFTRFPAKKTGRLMLKYALIYILFRKYTFHFRPLYDPYVVCN
jgi:hypothetical protein